MQNEEKPKRVVPASARQSAFEFCGELVSPGKSRLVEVPLMRLYTHSEISLPVKIFVGKRKGPTVFLSAAIHGDEVNGVEIIRRFLKHPALPRIRGVLIAVPVVNVHGLLSRSRYLPDRRDLNRSFPGSVEGSLAARVANLFMETVVERSDYGIDLHTGSSHRINLPQIRANLDDPRTKELAQAFGTPVILDSDIPDGSLRAAAVEANKQVLVYEGGEALRFDEVVIRAGLKGIVAVLRKVACLPPVKVKKAPLEPFVARSSSWIRAPESGLFRAHSRLGSRVQKGDILGFISDPFGEREIEVMAKSSGIIIGRSSSPLINEGEALFHVASFAKPREVERRVRRYRSALEPDDDALSDQDQPLV